MTSGDKEQVLIIADGTTSCQRYQAMSQRTPNQCSASAMKDKLIVRIHGGLSTGPKSAEGKQSASAPHIKYGQQTRRMRQPRAKKTRTVGVTGN